MSNPNPQRDVLASAIVRATADLARSRAAYGEGIAARSGLAPTDVEVLHLLSDDGALTVGRIGELTALTTGATTRLVDRLEQAGFVRRAADPADRRRVSVTLATERAAPVLDAYDRVDDVVRDALATWDDDALAALHGFLLRSIDAYRPDTSAGVPGVDRVRDQADGAVVESAVGAPIASATAGRLVFVTGAPSVQIAGAVDLGPELYRARFAGAVPSARVRDGSVTIRYPRFAWLDWRRRVGGQVISASAHWKRDTGHIVLNAALPWSIEARRGASAITADMRALRLKSFAVAGGAGSVAVALGRPEGIVRIQLSGGVSDVSVTRPADVAVVLTVAGGYREATLDGSDVWSTGRIATPGGQAASDRIEVEVSGGASKIVVTGEQAGRTAPPS